MMHKNITTGDNNIVIGKQAGDNITTAANCVIIGCNVDPASATQNKQLVIGSNGSNWITGDSSNGLKIANLTMTSTLSVGDLAHFGHGNSVKLRFTNTGSNYAYNYFDFYDSSTRRWFVGQNNDGNFMISNDNQTGGRFFAINRTSGNILLSEGLSVAGHANITSSVYIKGTSVSSGNPKSGITLQGDGSVAGNYASMMIYDSTSAGKYFMGATSSGWSA